MQVGTGKSILNGIAIGKLKIYKKKNIKSCSLNSNFLQLL